MGWQWPWRETPTSAPLEVLIAEAVAARLRNLDPFRLPVVVAARRLVADTVAMMPLVAVRDATAERLDPTPSVLRRPDPDEPRRTTLEKLVNSLTGHGQAWVQVTRVDGEGWPLSIKVIHPNRVTVTLDSTQSEVVALMLDGRPVDRRYLYGIPLTADLGPVGRSPLRDIADTLDHMVAVLQWSASYYTDGGPVPYALKNPTALPPEKARELLDTWTTARRERRPAMLTGTWSLETFPLPSASDALMIDALNYLDAAVSRAMLIPPSMLNVVSFTSLTYATTVDETRRWLATNLYPGYMSRLEAAFTDLIPRGQSAVFDTSTLLRTDWPTRVNTLAVGIGCNLYTEEEARAMEGMPATPNPAPVAVQPNVEGI